MTALDWINGGLGLGATGVLGFLAFRLLASVSDFTSKRYRESATYANARVDALEADLASLKETVRRLESENARQRQLKHDWRSFASSLYQERWTIKRFAEMHECAEITDLMTRLDHFRDQNPLMADIRAMTEGDPE